MSVMSIFTAKITKVKSEFLNHILPIKTNTKPNRKTCTNYVKLLKLSQVFLCLITKLLFPHFFGTMTYKTAQIISCMCKMASIV